MEGCRMYKVQEHVNAGEKVWNGYSGGEMYCTAPSDPGLYTLYELANDHNVHVCWKWVKEDTNDIF